MRKSPKHERILVGEEISLHESLIMNDDQSPQTSAGEAPAEAPSEVLQDYDESVDAITDRVDGKITDIKQHFGLIVDRRDRKITELQASSARRRLLVIDDAQSTVDILKGYLKGQRINVVGCSGKLARGLLESENFDAIMIEESVVVEAKVNGLVLCRELCDKGKGKSVIVMSSRPGDKIKNSVEQVGAAFLRKPFKGLELVRRVRDALLRVKK